MMKETVRKLALARRNALTQREIACKSKAIVQRLEPYLKGTIALYRSYGNEVCIDDVHLKSYGLPVVLHDTYMCFRMWHKGCKMKKGAYGIQEPIEGKVLLADELDVIVVPIVAFDEHLYRLGHGKGYYDRYLKQCRALKIGVAYDCQQVEKVPIEPHDVCLDMIIKETCIRKKDHL